MKHLLRRCAAFVLLLLPLGLRAAAQEGPDGSVDHPFLVQKLAGSVHIAGQNATFLSTVLVEECDPGWMNVLNSTRTDYHGHFSLKPATRKKLHYIRVSAAGFETGMFHVVLARDGAPELQLGLKPAVRPHGTGARGSPLPPLAPGRSAPSRTLTASLPHLDRPGETARPGGTP